jgi:hypothetical protein
MEQHKLLLQYLNNLKSSARGCLWFASEDGEGGEQNHRHLTRKSVPTLAELLLQCSLCLSVFSRALSASH